LPRPPETTNALLDRQSWMPDAADSHRASGGICECSLAAMATVSFYSSPAGSIANILKAHGLDPAPDRKRPDLSFVIFTVQNIHPHPCRNPRIVHALAGRFLPPASSELAARSRLQSTECCVVEGIRVFSPYALRPPPNNVHLLMRNRSHGTEGSGALRMRGPRDCAVCRARHGEEVGRLLLVETAHPTVRPAEVSERQKRVPPGKVNKRLVGSVSSNHDYPTGRRTDSS
jgi:hypothetical protein